jgi:tRNA G18 (ribose-2'-O)-methylase SpoU
VTVIEVDDPGDQRVADYVELTDPDHARGGGFVAEGLLVLDALLGTRMELRSVLCTPKRLDDVVGRVDAAVTVFVADQAVLDEVAGFHLHRGVVAIGERPPPTPLADVLAAPSLLVLEGINDLENLGSLFRNAAAFGIGAAVLCPRTADPLYRRPVRVSLGHVLRVPYSRADAWPAALGDITAAGFSLCALTPSGGVRIDAMAPPPRPALLVGAEGPGLTDAAIAAADHRVRIAMREGVDSLNVATSAAIAMHRLLEDPRWPT